MTQKARMPRVKPLEWDDVQAETPFGTYDFGYVGRVWTLRFRGGQIEYGIAGNYRTARAEAKEAAQHDFDTRILSTLRPTDPDPAHDVAQMEVRR